MRNSILTRLVLLTALFGQTAFSSETIESSRINAYLPEELLPELKEIIASAKINAPALQTQVYFTDESNERYEQAKARRRLNVGLFTNLGPRHEYYQSGNTDDTSSLVVNAGINLYRPIYHWGAIEAGIEQARLDGQSAEMALERKRSDLIRSLRADFLNLHLREQEYLNEVKRQRITEEKTRRAQLLHQSGKISEVELRSIRLEQEQSLLNMERIEQQKELITERFKVNYGWQQSLEVSPSIPEIQIDQAMLWLKAEEVALNKSAIYQLHPIQQQINALERLKEEQTIIAARNRPLVNLFLSGTQGQTNTATNNDVDTFTVIAGINVNWNIFDGFRTRHEKLEAKIKERRLEAQLENSVNDLMLEQKRILDSLSLRLRELNILEQQFSIQTDRHLEAKEDLKSGRITEPELEASSLALESMEYKLYEARANALMGISDYREFTRLIEPES